MRTTVIRRGKSINGMWIVPTTVRMLSATLASGLCGSTVQ
jgi:hypothetical protein